ncbi:UrcA family protein [Novosphingobium sp. 1949]|uniref:UrcA family protein n=1 Tax=Novosphingobium organovorum TaxID=2930092 RepID=A0ABT0BIV1_9SPHN|nr:UrcA family protein [Novosphingobium organovorum]MCJ2184773.1 UrcA family protein [Novosphingobium organovorum]
MKTLLSNGPLALGAALALCGASSAPAQAPQRTGADTYSIALSGYDAPPATRQAARRSLARIEAAAMRVCGASGFSLPEVRRAVRESACWRDAVASTLAGLDAPWLRQAYRASR